MRIEPPVSVPIAQGARRAATATPEPLLDPPGVRGTSASHGFHGVPRCWLVPQPPQANSTVCVLPSTISPWLTRRRTIVAVAVARWFSRLAEPPVVIRPSISMMSLIAIGMPCKSAWPERMALSAASATSRASGA